MSSIAMIWEICKSRPFISLFIAGSTIVIASEIAYFLYNKLFGRRSNKRRPNLKKGLLMTPEQVEQAKLNQRKPEHIWNTVLFFPDHNPDDPTSPTSQLVYYFDSARMSIHICMYLVSHPTIGEIVRKKYNEGLLVQVVTDWDTFTAHNNCGVKYWKRDGIEVRMKATGFLMHHKFAIIDEEALLTGSLNWTKQGLTCNQENVFVTTNKRIVGKYMEEFHTLWSLFAEEPYEDDEEIL